jgi:hypothetical protein
MNTTKEEKALPVLSYASGSGWSTLGMATSVEGAIAVASRFIGDAARNLVKHHGFKVTACRRTPLQRELNGGPDGYIFSVGKEVRHAGRSPAPDGRGQEPVQPQAFDGDAPQAQGLWHAAVGYP